MTTKLNKSDYQNPSIEVLTMSGLNAICAVSANEVTIGDVDVIEYGEI